jgi:hypothetical protein
MRKISNHPLVAAIADPSQASKVGMLVKRRWGHAQEDIFPVTQFEKFWGDMTSLAEASTEFFLVPRQCA